MYEKTPPNMGANQAQVLKQETEIDGIDAEFGYQLERYYGFIKRLGSLGNRLANTSTPTQGSEKVIPIPEGHLARIKDKVNGFSNINIEFSDLLDKLEKLV